MNHYNEQKSTNVEACKDKLKKLYGLPPYNNGSNICFNDGWFSMSIERDYTEETIKEAKRQLKR